MKRNVKTIELNLSETGLRHFNRTPAFRTALPENIIQTLKTGSNTIKVNHPNYAHLKRIAGYLEPGDITIKDITSRKLTKAEFAKEIKNHFQDQAGMTIAQAKEKIKEQMKTDEYNNGITAGNIRLFYTDNKNYGQGKENGYGKGWYLTNKGLAGGSEIKV